MVLLKRWPLSEVSLYDGEKFPGEVTTIDSSDVEVSVMYRSANVWEWPTPEDKIFYSRNQIVHIISCQQLQAIGDSLHLRKFGSYSYWMARYIYFF